jgi:O-antigen/teichoic acid export membrane protein
MAEQIKPENLEKQLLSQSLFYSFSLYMRMFLKLLGGIIIAKLLGPSLFGLKNAFDLAREYEMHSDLGTFHALNRLAPYYKGENKTEKAHMAINSVFGINMFYAVIVAAITIIVSLYCAHKGYEQRYIDFLFVLGVMVFFGKLHLFLQTKFRIDRKFFELSISQLVYGLTASMFGVILSYLWGFRGLLMSLVIAEVSCIGYLMSKERTFPKIRISFALYWQVLKIGFPMMILFLLLILLTNADRTLILLMISENALGYFGIATVASGVIATIPGAIRSVTLAPVMEKLGRTKDWLSIKHYLSEPMIIMAYALPVVMSFIFFFVHLPIKYYLEQYMLSIAVVKILMIAVFFESVSSPIMSVCLAINKQIALICLVIPLVVLNFSLNYLFIVAGWGINGVAMGTGITFFVCFCTLLYFASIQFRENLRTYFDNLTVILVPFSYASVLIFCIDTFLNVATDNLWFDLMLSLIKVGLFICCYSILLYRIRKHSGFIKLYTNMALIARKFKPRSFKTNPL